MSPRTEAQYKKIREKSRKIIINTAMELFANYGYHSTTIEKISKKAGISKGLIYNYYKSKDELLESVLMQGFNFIDEITKISQAKKSAQEKLQLLLENFTKSLQENLPFWKLYQNIISQPSIMHKLNKFKEYFESVFGPLLMSIFIELFGNEMSEQEIQIEVMLFAAFLDGIAFDYVIMGKEYPLDAIAQRLLEKYRNG
ncbi:MAG: TetR/AcrR family transcriptional regulator [Candidatus Cloacimonetes bacterium]|nr:TetR/AcrR family transcriptional regulator [Candidatus Cloacimonadota bacterium]